MNTEPLSPDNPWGLERLLDIKDLAEYLGVPVSTVYDWRTRNYCPPADRFGKHLKFSVSEVREWVLSSTNPLPLLGRAGGGPMSRQRLTIGTFGEIGFVSTRAGRVVARARYRDWDGALRLVQAVGDTPPAAARALKAKFADRSLFQPASSTLSPDSAFPALVAYWLDDLELEDRISKRTLQLYERNMRTLVLPAFANLTLREIGVARCDHFSFA